MVKKKKKSLSDSRYKRLSFVFVILSLFLILVLSFSIGLFYVNDSNKNEIENFSPLIIKKSFEVEEINESLIREYLLNAKESYHSFVSGKVTKISSYNGEYPGPILRGKVGDTLKINLINNLKEETTIHWHGIQLPNSQDGVPDVTQTPVKPEENFSYEFELKNSGIYWYHPHYNTAEQIERGLYGVIVVDDENESLIKSDKDVVYILDDIRLNSNYQVDAFWKGHMDNMHGRFGNIMSINGESSYDIEGNKGDVVRLRLVNTANARFFNFKIEGHKLLVIGEDIGLVEKSYEVDMLTLSPGERYDVLVYLNADKDEYKILDYYYGGSNVIGSLKYVGVGEDSKEDYESLKGEMLNSYLPDWSSKLSDESNYTVELEGVPEGPMELRWTLNGKSYPGDFLNLSFNEGEFYKIKFVNTQTVAHPIHIHGEKFLILSRNGVVVKEKGWKDTVIVNALESVEIGLIAEGKGSWATHCHILEHAEYGMMGVINVE